MPLEVGGALRLRLEAVGRLRIGEGRGQKSEVRDQKLMLRVELPVGAVFQPRSYGLNDLNDFNDFNDLIEQMRNEK